MQIMAYLLLMMGNTGGISSRQAGSGGVGMIGLGGMITGAGRKVGGGGRTEFTKLEFQESHSAEDVLWPSRNRVKHGSFSELNHCFSELQGCFSELGLDSRDRVVSPTTCSFAASFPTLDSLRRVRRRSMQGRQGS